MRALILCAGRGTRLGLKRTPKCMVKVNKKPVLEHLVNHLNKHGIHEIIVNVHKDYDKIFKYFGTRLIYFYEPTLLGEFRTERMLKEWLGDEYIIMNGDTLTNLDITKLTSSPTGTVFVIDGTYAGTRYVCREHTRWQYWDGDGAYYFDIGTPEGLRRARRLYEQK